MINSEGDGERDRERERVSEWVIDSHVEIGIPSVNWEIVNPENIMTSWPSVNVLTMAYGLMVVQQMKAHYGYASSLFDQQT